MAALTPAQIKIASLVILMAQNSALALVLRLSKTQKVEYLSSTAIVTAEVLKALVCFGVTLKEDSEEKNRGLVSGFWKTVDQCFGSRMELMKIALPSIMYLIQNNLQFYAISNLQAASFQVLCQLKILTTAIFSITLLGRSITAAQWSSLFMLMIGVAMVQLSTDTSKKVDADDTASSREQNVFLGLIAIVLACCCSGFAGVYTEKILKGSQTTLWVRNVQMGVISCLVGLTAILFTPAERSFVIENGFYYGYAGIVWVAVLLQGLGGLMTAVVVKYADNIIKSFATSLAVVLSSILSIFLFGIYPSAEFLLGAGLVNAAVFAYNRKPAPANPQYAKVPLAEDVPAVVDLSLAKPRKTHPQVV